MRRSQSFYFYEEHYCPKCLSSGIEGLSQVVWCNSCDWEGSHASLFDNSTIEQEIRLRKLKKLNDIT